MEITNHPFLYILTIIVLLVITAGCVVFLISAWREGKKRGIDVKVMKQSVSSTIAFSIAPSIAILLTVLTLAGLMGLPFPWLRLSVVGAITYEVPAAQNAAVAVDPSGTIATAAATKLGFTTMAYSMTIGIICALPVLGIVVPAIRKRMDKVKHRDEKWAKILSSALFLGMIATFIGMAFTGITTDRTTNESIPATSGSILVSVLTFITAAVFMCICGLLVKKMKWKWLKNYALPISLVGGMAMAILYRSVLPATLFM